MICLLMAQHVIPGYRVGCLLTSHDSDVYNSVTGMKHDKLPKDLTRLHGASFYGVTLYYNVASRI